MSIVLFDVDGTLTQPRQKIQPEMKETLQLVRKSRLIGIISGSDFNKIMEQLGSNILEEYDYVFAENGLVAYKGSDLISCQSICEHLSEPNIQRFINYCLQYLSGVKIPIKRGTFIEFRRGMINISPIGRNCTQKERDEFEIHDIIHKVRQTMIDNLKLEFSDLNLTYSIGGQISFDVFPQGWDKSYCLKYLENLHIDFFGDKTQKGGNDYEIFINQKVIGHSVQTFTDTQKILKTHFI